MRIPTHLLPEIVSRHAAGQSDQAVVDWLAQLDPPVTVSRIAVLKARKRTAAPTPAAASKSSAARPSAPKSPVAQAVASMGRTKKTGAQNRKAQAAQNAQNAAQHVQRGAFVPPIPEERDPMRGHLHSLKSILAYQHEINVDKIMNLPDKVRMTAVLAQAMAKASIQAELELKLAAAQEERAREAADFAEDIRAVEVQKKSIAAEKAEIEAEWRRINEARAKFAAEQRAAGVPVVQALA